jgi:hypothetical protein
LAAETVGFCGGLLDLLKLHEANSSRSMEQDSRGPDSLTAAQSGRVVVIAVGGAEDGSVSGGDQVTSDGQLLPVESFQVRKEIANRFLRADVRGQNHRGGNHKER